MDRESARIAMDLAAYKALGLLSALRSNGFIPPSIRDLADQIVNEYDAAKALRDAEKIAAETMEKARAT